MMIRRLLLLVAAAGVSSPAAAQVGVYADDGPSNLQEAGQRREGIRITGTAGRQRVIPETYTVNEGDTLWDVAGRFYGSPWEWPRVWSYNPAISNPHWIYPLDRIRLLPPGESSPIPEAGGETGITSAPARVGSPEESVLLRQEGFIDPDALRQAGTLIGSPSDHMLLTSYDEVYVRFDEDQDAPPEGEYTIFRQVSRAERRPQTAGSLIRIYGTVRIDSYDPERRTARATIVEALDPIERGYRVAAVPRRFDLIPPRVADADVSSEVVASLRPTELVGEQQVVFLPVGFEDGVRPGNRFFLLRSGDQWRDSVLASNPNPYGPSVPPPAEPDAYPAQIVAEGRVVDVQPSSAALLVTLATREINVGDRAEMRRGY
ncbi:MAG: LysM peptidoglycan-binding domain-containing protein [Sandaracinaceae bacterium]